MWLSRLLVSFAQALVSGHCRTQLSTLGSAGLWQQLCIWSGAKVGGEFLENMFTLLLKVGVISLGQPREEMPELPWIMTWPLADTPVGWCHHQRMQPVRGLEMWNSLCILGWQAGLGW